MPMRRRSGATMPPRRCSSSRRAMRDRAGVDGSKPAMQRSTVVLPQPDGPSRQPIAPGSQAERQAVEDRRARRSAWRTSSSSSSAASVGWRRDGRVIVACIAENRRSAQAASGACRATVRPPRHRERHDRIAPRTCAAGPSPRLTARLPTASRRSAAARLARRCLDRAARRVPIVVGRRQRVRRGTGGTWAHLAATVLPDYIAHDAAAVRWASASGVMLLGVGAAWLVTARVDFPAAAQSRVGAAAAAGDAGVRDGLRVHRLAAVRRPGADGAARADRLGPRRLLVSRTCARSAARCVMFVARALSLRLPARAHRVPRAVGQRCSKSARSLGLRPWRALRARRAAARAAGDRRGHRRSR